MVGIVVDIDSDYNCNDSDSDCSYNKFALLWGEAQLCLPYVCL